VPTQQGRRLRRASSVALVVVGVLAACSTGPGPEREPSGQAGTSDPRPETLRLPADLSTLERARLGAPGAAPSESSLADLLGVRPTVATMAYRPLESPEDGSGWSSETIYFHAPREGWLRLGLADLALDPDGWPGPDTYGAGHLSPDGRRWAGQSAVGVVVLELATGRAQTTPIRGGVAAISWAPDSRSLLVDSPQTDRTYFLPRPGTTRPAQRLPFRLLGSAFRGEGIVHITATSGGAAEVRRWRELPPSGAPEISTAAREIVEGRTFGSAYFPRGDDGPFVATLGETGQRLGRVSADGQEVAAVLRPGKGTFFVKYLGFGQRGYFLALTPEALVAWRPDSGELRLVFTPGTGPWSTNAYDAWDLSVALDHVG